MTGWRYPRPLGLLGNLGFDEAGGFEHTKIEEFADRKRTERVDKSFRYRYRPLPSKRPSWWIWEKPAWADAVPYRAQELRTAVVQGGAQIWVTEGEADTDALVELGEVATSSHRGSAGFAPAMAEWFAMSWYPKRVTIVADRDLAGASCALTTYDAVREHVPAHILRIVATPLSRAGADVRDHLAAGFGLRDFEPVDIQELRAYADANRTDLGTRAAGSGPYTTELQEAIDGAGGWKPRRAGEA
jgi:hypothetical protein